MHAKTGDRTAADRAHVGQPGCEGEILDVVLGESEREHYRVRWDDGHESI